VKAFVHSLDRFVSAGLRRKRTTATARTAVTSRLVYKTAALNGLC
jgi:hypothetical protein